MKRASALFLVLSLLCARAFGQTTTGTTAGQSTSATGAAAAGAANNAAGTAAPAPGAASSQSTPDLSVPVDAAKEWTVGFTVFSGEGLSPENAYLAFSLPLLLEDEVSGLTTHAYTKEEGGLARKAIISRELLTVEQGITRIRKERDALLFGDTPPTPSALSALDVRLAAILARRDFLQGLDSSKIEVKDEKPIKRKEGSGVGKLLDTPHVPPAVFCARQGLDLLLGGSVREVQGYLVMDAWAYDAAMDRIVFTAREAAQRDELYASLPDSGRDLARVILGKKWAKIAFSPDPPSASLYIDGNLLASGVSPALYISPGEHEVQVTSPGCFDQTQSITLEEGQEFPLAVTLVRLSGGSVTISSVPPGASLYLDSIFQGTTPLSLGKPFTRSRVVLSLPGFYDVPFSIGVDSPPEVTYSLQKDVGPRDRAQKKARDDFYAAFGWFAVSLPLPLFSYAFYIDNYVLAFNTGSPSAQLSSNIFLVGYYGGAAISVALFTWMVFRIIHYVSVSNGIAG
jgi:hypothetical protein